MGVCTYKGGTVPASSRGMCIDNGGTWTEGDEKPSLSEKFGFDDFASAVGETYNNIQGGDNTAKENLAGYVTRRWDENPYGLAFDAALMYGGGSLARLALTKTGIGGMLKNLVRKKTTKTKTKKPEIDPVTKRIKKGSTYSDVTTTGWRPRIVPSALIGGAAYQADKAGVLPFGIGPFSEAGKEAQYQRRLKSVQDAVAGLDKKANTAEQKANAERIAKEEAKAAQDKIDNMSFFDKWKLGMKDPRTAALFGAGLRDIGSNIPGHNQLGEMQMELADADAAMAAANKPNAALHNVTKVSNKELMTRFTDDPTFIIGSDTEEARKATYMLGMYRSLEAQLLKAGLPADDVTIMRLLEEDSKRA